jgi:hypothetical protein
VAPFIFLFVLVGASFEGVVQDSKTKELLPSASVYLEGTSFGTATDDKGHFRIENIPAGEYYLVISLIGYRPFRQLIVANASDRLTKNALLVSEVITLPGIQVTGHRNDFLREVKPSSYKITPREFGIPPPFLENDLFRTLQTLPGVVTVSDFSSALYVRGSSPDQNLVLLDGAQVYNPFHLGGLFSTFETDALESAEFLTGGFPAEFGGHLASVLDVRTYPGDTTRYQGLVGASVLGSRFRFEGPLPKGSFLVSGRYTYFDKVLPLFGVTFPYYFYDGHGTVRFHPFANTVIKFSGFLSNDNFHLAEEGFDLRFGWGNKAASLNLTQIFTDKFFSQFTAAWSQLHTDFVFGDLFNINNSMNDRVLKNITTIQWAEHDFKFGFEYKHTDFRYETKIMNLVNDTIQGQPNYGALFCQATFRPWTVLIIEPGIRVDYYRVHYTETKTYTTPDPRLGLKYFLTPATALKLSFGRYHQFIGSTMPEQGMLPVYFWIPIFDAHPPQEAFHYIFGIERVTDTQELMAEVYYKNLSSLLVFNDNLDPKDVGGTIFLPAKGNACGIDILAKERWGKFQGWLTYSLGYSRFERNNVEYYTSFDRRHSLSLIGSYQLTKGWDLSLRFNLGSGLPYTGAVTRYRRYRINPFWDDYRFRWTEIGGTKNGQRYPVYHRLDFNIAKNFRLGFGNLTVTAQVINVYNNKNVFIYYYDYRTEPPIRRSVTMIPLIGSVNLELKF